MNRTRTTRTTDDGEWKTTIFYDGEGRQVGAVSMNPSGQGCVYVAGHDRALTTTATMEEAKERMRALGAKFMDHPNGTPL